MVTSVMVGGIKKSGVFAVLIGEVCISTGISGSLCFDVGDFVNNVMTENMSWWPRQPTSIDDGK